jgi:hypothetical protein
MDPNVERGWCELCASPTQCVPPVSSESLLAQSIRDTNDVWPESAMNVGNLSAHQTANEDLIAIAYGAS